MTASASQPLVEVADRIRGAANGKSAIYRRIKFIHCACTVDPDAPRVPTIGLFLAGNTSNIRHNDVPD
ncbi:hypothetical protein AB1N83_004468 [Pleurotus pulmonarius]